MNREYPARASIDPRGADTATTDPRGVLPERGGGGVAGQTRTGIARVTRAVTEIPHSVPVGGWHQPPGNGSDPTAQPYKTSSE